ncbi:MAG: substrate-binding periplasmic protein [Fervidobacterium sp.]
MRVGIIIVMFVLSIFTCSNFGQFLKVGFLLGTPYAFWSAQRFAGIDYDILKKIAESIGYQLDVYVLPFTVLNTEILNFLGLDIIAGGIHMTEERKKSFNFSIPYAQSGLAIVLRKELQWNGDVEKITFAVKKGATGEKVVQEWIKNGKNVKYTEFVSNDEITASLLMKKADAAFFDYINALYISKIFGFTVYKDLIYRVQLGYIVLNKSIENKFNDALKKNSVYIQQVIAAYVGQTK